MVLVCAGNWFWHGPDSGGPAGVAPSGDRHREADLPAGAGPAAAVPRHAQGGELGGGRAVGPDGGDLRGGSGAAAVGVPSGEPLAAPGGGERHVLADPGREVPADGEHEGPRRPVGGGHGGRAAGGEHDRGPGHGPAGSGGHRPGGGGDGGGEYLRRRRGPHGVPDPGRRAPGLFLQGGEHHGFHAGIRGAAL